MRAAVELVEVAAAAWEPVPAPEAEVSGPARAQVASALEAEVLARAQVPVEAVSAPALAAVVAWGPAQVQAGVASEQARVPVAAGSASARVAAVARARALVQAAGEKAPGQAPAAAGPARVQGAEPARVREPAVSGRVRETVWVSVWATAPGSVPDWAPLPAARRRRRSFHRRRRSRRTASRSSPADAAGA